MLASLHIANPVASLNVCKPANAFDWFVGHTANMVEEKQRNYLRAWREFRELTQEQLADKVGTDKGVISLLESGARRLSDKWLRKLAPALNTTPGHLLDHDPNNMPTDILDIWSKIDDRDRAQAARVLSSFVKTGTSDR
jgi:transcriptional regulator with XRE-family HTH domain